MPSPAAPYPVELVDLLMLRDDVALDASTTTVDDPDLAATFWSSTAVAKAVLVTEPASTSAWVTV